MKFHILTARAPPGLCKALHIFRTGLPPIGSQLTPGVTVLGRVLGGALPLAVPVADVEPERAPREIDLSPDRVVRRTEGPGACRRPGGCLARLPLAERGGEGRKRLRSGMATTRLALAMTVMGTAAAARSAVAQARPNRRAPHATARASIDTREPDPATRLGDAEGDLAEVDHVPVEQDRARPEGPGSTPRWWQRAAAGGRRSRRRRPPESEWRRGGRPAGTPVAGRSPVRGAAA